MDSCEKTSCHNSPWQATLEGILSNLKGEFQVAASTNALSYQPVPKKLTNEAIFMLYVILIFIILNIIGSFISGVECFCKEYGKEISSLLVKGKVKATNLAAYTDGKPKSFKSSAFHKQKEVNISDIKQILLDGLQLTFKLVSKNGVWKNCKKYLACFSIQSNARKLLSTVSGEESLNCLHGIKLLGLLWVFVSHVCMFFATIIGTISDEFQFVLEFPIVQVIVNGIFANDIFFVLSGFTTAYMFFDYYKKTNGKIPWLLFYIGKFLRFTPLYLLILGFYATLFTYIGSGSLWPTYDTNPLCRENWIWNVLYLNNFISPKKQCMLTTWYIACDLQLYVISPLFLLPLIRRPKVGFALIVTCVLGSCFTSFLLTKQFDLTDGPSKVGLYSHNMSFFYSRFWKYFDLIYVKPYTRIGSYLIGVALGYFLFQRKFDEGKKNSLVTLTVGWIVTAIFLLISLFAIYNRDESTLERAVYNGGKHLLFSCALSWVIFVCVTGQAGLINYLLSHKLCIIFSRLSYCFYFIHIIAIEKYVLSIDELIDYSFTAAVLLHLRLLFWTLAVSFVVSLIFERPLLNLLGLLLKKDKPKNKVE